jgi:hypothetical protein
MRALATSPAASSRPPGTTTPPPALGGTPCLASARGSAVCGALPSLRATASPGARMAAPRAAWCPVARQRPGTRLGTAGATSGHAQRTWACAAAAGLCRSDPPAAPPSLARLEHTQDPGQGGTLLAQPLARAGSSRLPHPGACETETWCQRAGRGAEAPDAARDHPGPGPHRGAPDGGMPCGRARPRASRARDPAPCAVRGPPRSRRLGAALGANGQRGRLLPRAWRARDHASALSPLCDEDGRRARSHGSGAAATRSAARPSSRPC